jgi:hypothetical protein
MTKKALRHDKKSIKPNFNTPGCVVFDGKNRAQDMESYFLNIANKKYEHLDYSDKEDEIKKYMREILYSAFM